MSIPIARPVLGDEEIAAVTEILSSGKLAGGEVVARFEKAFARYTGAPFAIATSSGTTALFASLWCLGLPPGERVLTTPFTFVASANAILYCQLTPVFCDIDNKTFNLSTEALSEIMKNGQARPKALVAVHLYGQPCPMDEIMDIARENDLRVIEDCAQSHGALWRARRVGSFGDLGVFSFYPTKNMTTGEGGMVVTGDPALAEKIRMFINHGSKTRYRHELLGYNFRMTDINAAIGIVQLRKLDEMNRSRRRNAAELDRLLGGLDCLEPPYVHPDAYHVYHQYTIRCAARDELADHLSAHGIGTGIHYPMPVHKQPLYKKLGYGRLCLPEADKASAEVLSLPVHPSLTPGDLKYITEKVHDFLSDS